MHFCVIFKNSFPFSSQKENLSHIFEGKEVIYERVVDDMLLILSK